MRRATAQGPSREYRPGTPLRPTDRFRRVGIRAETVRAVVSATILILVPALVYLYALFQRREPRPEPARAPGTASEAGTAGTTGPA